MAEKVRVEIGEARVSQDRLRRNLDHINNDLLADLQRIVQETRTWYEGDTTEAFIESFEAGVVAFKKYLDKIQQHGAAMVNSVEKQHSHDQGLAKNIRIY